MVGTKVYQVYTLQDSEDKRYNELSESIMSALADQSKCDLNFVTDAQNAPGLTSRQWDENGTDKAL